MGDAPKNPPDELDLAHNPHPVCPYCGASEYDSWEWGLSEQEVECHKCGEVYLAKGEMVVFWTTKKKQAP